MKDGRETLKHFDNVFNTETIKNIKFNNMKLLKALYDYFEEDIYTPSNKYSTLRHKHTQISDELEKTFTTDQKELFEKYWEIDSQMCEEENEQLFLFGYISKRIRKRDKISLINNICAIEYFLI